MTWLLAPWSTASDDALLDHFRRDRGVRYEPMFDEESCSEAHLRGVMQGRFEFQGEAHDLNEPINWLHNPSSDIEWHILLHKFYYAVGLTQRWKTHRDKDALQRWQQLLSSWMTQTPAGFIAADVTGRRVQNWIYSLHAVLADAPIDAAFFRRLLKSIHDQVEYLCENLTPKRNHRTLELLAIYLAGVVFPEMARASAWRAFAWKETLANVQADLLADGVHCELSTDYHHLAIRNWLQFRKLATDHGHAVPDAFDQSIERALTFSLHVHQPSGLVPSFSDGDVHSYLPLLRQGAVCFRRSDMDYVASGGLRGTTPTQRVAHFPQSGYHIIRSAWAGADAQHLVFDCGPLGEGNHGHFDALSFELAAHGQALVVDPGRYTYSEAGDVNWRVHFRSTAAHNTVCVDGLNQTPYTPKAIKSRSRHATGSIRHKVSGPPPLTTLLEAQEGQLLDLLHGQCKSHAYDAMHDRVLVLIDRRYWIVSDRLRAEREHDYQLGFQLTVPEAMQWQVDDGCTTLVTDGLTLAQVARDGQRATLDPSFVSKRYGSKQAALAMRTRVRAINGNFDTIMLPWVKKPPTVRVMQAGFAVSGSRHEPVICIELDSGTDHWFHGLNAHADTTWRWKDWGFTGRWLHWRENHSGQLVRAVSHAGARLQTATGEWPLALP